MRTDLNRDDFVELLKQLDSEDEAAVLAAARDIHAKMTVAGVTWDDLLISQDEEVDDEPDDELEYEEDLDSLDDEDEDETTEVDGEDDDGLSPINDEEKKEALALIETIGAMEVSQATKDELKDYKNDIKEDEFEQMDLRYLRALKARLSS